MFVSVSELRHRITFLRPTSTVDNEGNLIEESQQTLFTLWAKVLPYAAKISNGYAEKVEEINYRIAIRYREDIEVTDLISWRGKTLIQTAPPYGMDGKRKYLILEAKEFVEDG